MTLLVQRAALTADGVLAQLMTPLFCMHVLAKRMIIPVSSRCKTLIDLFVLQVCLVS